MLVKMYNKIGKKWAIIGKLMDNRSDIEVKNRFLVLERQNKKLEKLRNVPLFDSQQPQERFLSSDIRNEMLNVIECKMSAPTKKANVTISLSHYNNSMDSIRPSPLIIPRLVTSPLVRLGLY